jgi:hypothetical protein
MFRSSFKMFLVLMAVAALAAWASSASADLVASWDGPQDFNGTSDKVVLPNVSIGQEGSVWLKFKADTTTGMHTLWYDADAPWSTVGEYRINLYNGSLNYQLYPCNTAGGTNFTDTASWHSLSLQWKQGSPTLFTLDGVAKSVSNDHALAPSSWASTTGNHALGCLPQPSPSDPIRWFDGQISNVQVYNTYAPEPSATVLAVTGLLGLLAYAWRKRR